VDDVRFSLLTYGTRGDVAPIGYVAAELSRRGHDAVVLAPPDLVPFVGALGVDARPVGVPMTDEAQRRWQATDSDDALREVLTRLDAAGDATNDAVLDASMDADVVVSGFYLEGPASCVAEATGAGLAFLHYAPYRTAPGSFDDAIAPRAPGLAADSSIARKLERIMFRYSRGDVSALRDRLGLPASRLPTSRRAEALGALELQAYSPSLVQGFGAWGPRRPLIGCPAAAPADVEAHEESALEPGLADFLDAGPSPLYVGFGSIPVLNAERLDMFRTAAADLGLRLLIFRGWSDDLAVTPSNDLFIASRPVHLPLLMSRCVASVHHGGSGTTGTLAAVGIPQLICSVLGDQLFWGDQIVRRGLGCHLRLPDLDTAALRQCLAYLLTDEVRARAADIAASIAREPLAVLRAADLLESLAIGTRGLRSTS
jgi:sterol 3beta-glucosyltransferase